MRRPCERLPAEWWDSDNDGARLALALCRYCPGLAGCDAGRQWGVIRAGVAWGDDGKPLPICGCGYPNSKQRGGWGPVNPLCHRCAPAVSRMWSPRVRDYLKRKAEQGPFGEERPDPPRRRRRWAEVDVVQVERVLDGHWVRLARAGRLEAVRRGAARGWPDSLIAERLRITRRSVQRTRGTYRIPAGVPVNRRAA